LASLPDAELAAVCELDARRVAEIARQYPNVSVTQSFDDVVGDPSIDGLILATPASTHADMAIRALDAGKHVLVEKPLSLTVEEGARIVAEAERCGRVLLVGHTFEYNAAVRKVRELIAAGDIGELYYLYSQRVNLGRVRNDCNAMWSLAPHDVSIANFLIGEPPIWASATGHRFLENDREDVVFLNIGYPGGRIAHVHVSWLDPNKIRRTTVVGSEKMIVYDELSANAKVQVFDKGVSKVPLQGSDYAAPPFGEFQFQTRTGDIWIPNVDFAEPLRAEIAHFVDCINGRAEPLTDGHNGLAVVRVLAAAQESMENGGTPVDVR
ncbi:MAG: Gfo/Idh/MocA family oxidoreductase, partial [Deltaproteobacteria bacterium]